jgi:anti-anti-sigma regulatory factor
VNASPEEVAVPETCPELAHDEVSCAWPEEVTWREVADLREVLFDLLETPQSLSVRLDVRGVKVIDGTGVGLLIGANHRAAALGRRLVLIDGDGAVSAALRRIRMLSTFRIARIKPVHAAPPV